MAIPKASEGPGHAESTAESMPGGENQVGRLCSGQELDIVAFVLENPLRLWYVLLSFSSCSLLSSILNTHRNLSDHILASSLLA